MTTSPFDTVTVLGTGVLGSQIIFQTAYSGIPVVDYDISDEALAKLPARWEQLKSYYRRDLQAPTPRRSTSPGAARPARRRARSRSTTSSAW